jgi:hypothetical protein
MQIYLNDELEDVFLWFGRQGHQTSPRAISISTTVGTI